MNTDFINYRKRIFMKKYLKTVLSALLLYQDIYFEAIIYNQSEYQLSIAFRNC